MNKPQADSYNALQLAARAILPAHITELVASWQERHGLDIDGALGAQTRASLDKAIQARAKRAWAEMRVYPLRALADGRQPKETSGFHSRNPDRPNHRGSDLFYARAPGDPPMKVGDGGRTANWWIPEGQLAVAGAPGMVTHASKIATGFRVWIDVGGGWSLGYFHLWTLLVLPGQLVDTGTALGTIGDNPVDNDAKHLHFELYFGDLAEYPKGCRDPLQWLNGATILSAV